MSLLTLAIAAAITPQFGSLDSKRASIYFREFKLVAELDNGRLWGKSIDGPILFVDPATRAVVTNQGDTEVPLKEQNGVFVGTLSTDKFIANAFLDWGKTRWVMIMWPVSDNYTDRMELMVHEAFHRIQTDLGFVREGDPCEHLNTLEGRYWMQLEWRSLAKALQTSGDQRKSALRDSLHFRKYRYRLFAEAQKAEGRLERLEGTPSYTGAKLRGTSEEETLLSVARKLEDSVSKTENLPRMFAYLTGPAYGLLLDQAGTSWRARAFEIEDFGASTAAAYAVNLAGDLKKAAQEAERRYNAASILKSERDRDVKIKRQIADFERLVVHAPVLTLPIGAWRASTNALKMTPIGKGRIVHTF
jgi:hypothetical protein